MNKQVNPTKDDRGQEVEREYEAPEAVRLRDKDRAFGACDSGSTPYAVGYRVHEFEGVCVTGKSATEGCYAGL